MGKIIASYQIKVHLHVDDDEADVDAPTNDVVKDAVIAGLQTELEQDEVTVSEIDRVDE